MAYGERAEGSEGEVPITTLPMAKGAQGARRQVITPLERAKK